MPRCLCSSRREISILCAVISCDAEAIKHLMNSWKTQPSPALNERTLWKEWTASELGQEPSGLNDPVAGESEEGRRQDLRGESKGLICSRNRAGALRAAIVCRGRRRRSGRTPDELHRGFGVSGSQMAEQSRQHSSKGNYNGSFCGFCHSLDSLCSRISGSLWIGRGFRDDLSEEGKQSTGSEPAGRD